MRTFGACGGVRTHPVHLPWLRACIYIPSTLGGPVHTAKGTDENQLKKSLDLAADVYISRVQGAPCGEAKVQLYKGADGPEAKKLLNRRQMLLKFLSGKSTEIESLQRNQFR